MEETEREDIALFLGETYYQKDMSLQLLEILRWLFAKAWILVKSMTEIPERLFLKDKYAKEKTVVEDAKAVEE